MDDRRRSVRLGFAGGLHGLPNDVTSVLGARSTGIGSSKRTRMELPCTDIS